MGQLAGFQADTSPSPDDGFREEVLRGLSPLQKTLPSRFFYDAQGSVLFERITELTEYYPTRTEIALIKSKAQDIRNSVPAGAVIVEFGSGSSRKTGLLLEALEFPCAYVPIEISSAALYPAAARIKQAFPSLGVYPILGGFHDLEALQLPSENFNLGFFPGSTIGNFTPIEAVSFLQSARRLLGRSAAMIVGADLQKPLDILLPAYNDASKVTAAFNLNILARINRELDGTFDLASFNHEAIYNDREGRIEMHLRSAKVQSVSVAGRHFYFSDAETIHTENSYKYTIAGFQALALEAGWRPEKVWVDKDNLFSIHLLA
jgi:dimethylhistidine N-methyltransferase